MKANAFSAGVCLCLCSLGCAITDYSPWPGHKTQGEAKLLFQEIAFTGIDPTLDGTYSYSVSYDHSNVPLGAFPGSITITSYHNNGGTITASGAVLPPAFNPDGLADRLGSLSGEYGSYNFFPPWTPDQRWGRYFVSVDTDGDCQFFANVKQDNSGSPFGPGLALCFGAPSEETGEVVELEKFASLDNLLGRIWDGSLSNNFTMTVAGVSFNGAEHAMTNTFTVGLKHTGFRPTALAVDFTQGAGKELLQAILNGTTDKAPTRIGMRFAGGLKLNLPQSWKVAFNHAVIRKALGL
jgi:hypothetical protein